MSSVGGARTESGESSHSRTHSLEHVDVRRLQVFSPSFLLLSSLELSDTKSMSLKHGPSSELQVQKKRLEKALKEAGRHNVEMCAGYAAELAAMGDAVAAEAEEGLSFAAQLSAERAELQIEAGMLRADAGVTQVIHRSRFDHPPGLGRLHAPPPNLYHCFAACKAWG